MIKNYTPHDVTVYDDDGPRPPYPSHGQARVAVTARDIGWADGVPVQAHVFWNVTGLPDPKPGVFLIVSSLVRAALPYRRDLISPDTSPGSAVRDNKGVIIGVRRFVSS